MNSVSLSFYDAVDNNDLTNFKRYVGLYRIDLNNKFSTVRKRTHADLAPIHLAASRGHADMLAFIIRSKSDININTGTLRRTALHFAILRHQTVCMNLLLDNGAVVNTRDNFGNTPCHYAAEDGDVDIINKLVEKGADINAEDIRLKTPLMKAVRNGRFEAVKCLLRAGCQVNGTDINRETALHFAARIDNVSIVECLISAGIKLNSRNKNGRTPLIEAVEYGRIANVQRLVDANCDVSIADFEFQETAPLFAIRRNHTVMLQIFLAHGVTQKLSRRVGESLFLSALENNKVEAFKMLVSYNCESIITPNTFSNFLKARAVFLASTNTSNVSCFSEYAIKKGSIEVGLLLAHLNCDVYSRRSEVAGLLAEVDGRTSSDIDVTAVPSLKRLCRKSIRSCLSYKVREETEMLPIPKALKQFVLLADIN